MTTLIYISNLPMGLACIYQGCCTKIHAAMCIMYTFIAHKPRWMSFFSLYLEKDEMTRKPLEHLYILFNFVSCSYFALSEISFFGFFHPFPPGCNLSCRNLHKCFIFCELKLLAVLESIPPGSQKHRGQVPENWPWSASCLASLKERGWGSIVCSS